MRIFLLMLIGLGFSNLSFAKNGYSSCYVENGKAHLLFCSETSDSGSGTGSLKVFDRYGQIIDSDNILIWIGIAIRGCDEVDTESVPEEAVDCYFNLHN